MNIQLSKRFLLSIAFSLFITVALAQKGVPFISNFELPPAMSNQNWAITQSEDDHQMFILNRKGVYVFDGIEWIKLNIVSKPIAIFSSNNLFVGTEAEIGYFKRDKKGNFNYYTVQDSTLDIYFKFLRIDNDLYASGTQHISKILLGDVARTEPVYVESDSTQMITDFFELNGIIYIIKNKNTLYRLDNNAANRQPLNLEKGETIKFSFNHNNHSYIGTSSNRLFLFNGWQFKPLGLKDKSYLNASYINGGISIDSNRFALSTLIGGCSIINSKTLESESIINYSSGLPDDEIYSLGVDYNKGLWIAHGMGISRVDLNIPVRSYEFYDGVSGNILSIAEFNRTLYVGGSEGLFYLSQVKNFTPIETPVTQPRKEQVINEVVVPTTKPEVDTKQPIEEKDSKKKKKGFFSRLFSKSDKAEVQTFDLPSSTGETIKKDKGEKTIVQKKINMLQTVSNIYQRIPGVEGKCKQLLVFNSKLLASTSTGLYEVSLGKGIPVVKGSYILFVKPSDLNPKSSFVCSSDGISELTLLGEQWKSKKLFSFEGEYPLSLVELSDNNLIVTTEFNVYNLSIVMGGESLLKKITPTGTPIESPVVRKVAGVIKVFTSNRIYSYNSTKDALVEDVATTSIKNINTIYSQSSYSWVNIGRQWNLFSADKSLSIDAATYLSLFDRVNDIYVNANNDLYIINDYSQIVKISALKDESGIKELPFFFKQVSDNKGVVLDINDIKLSYSNNALNIKLGAPSFVKEKSVEFQYLIEGLTNTWSEWSNKYEINQPYFPSGKYKLKIKARDVLGHESAVYTLPFTVKPPIWKTFWFIGLCIILIVFLFFQFMKYRERQLQKEKQILEQKVQERTKTIEEQKAILQEQRDELAQTNEEILQQKEEIEAQRDEIEAQNDHISKQNLEMTQSIEYAKRIQTAIMPSTEAIKSILPEHFILFRPRDIVSGDFYWMTKNDSKIIIAAADCTGHGVPGAFMSMLGISFLNEIVNVRVETKPNLILNHLRDSIKSTLSQTGKEGESKDGMDIAICTIDLNARKLEFAGAYNPLYLIRNGELTEIKADKMPVGIHMAEKESFTLNELDFEMNDCIYIFSDGYVSQFGGEYGRKFMAKPFKKLLAIIAEKPMGKQFEILDQEYEDWRGYNSQVDDVLVIGIKFT